MLDVIGDILWFRRIRSYRLYWEFYVVVTRFRKDRVTIQEKEKEEIRAKEAQVEAKKMAEERRFQTLKVRRNFHVSKRYRRGNAVVCIPQSLQMWGQLPNFIIRVTVALLST